MFDKCQVKRLRQTSSPQTMSKKRSSTITDWLAGARAAKTVSNIPVEPASSQGLIQYQPTVEILRDHDENAASSSVIKNPTTSIEWPSLLTSSETSDSLSAPTDINCNAGRCSFSTAYHPTTQIELESSRNKEGRMCQLQWFQSYKWLSYCKVRSSLAESKGNSNTSSLYRFGINSFFCIRRAAVQSNQYPPGINAREEAFITNGFDNWKKALNRFDVHGKSSGHLACVLAEHHLPKTSIGVELDSTRFSRVHKNSIEKCWLLKFLLLYYS